MSLPSQGRGASRSIEGEVPSALIEGEVPRFPVEKLEIGSPPLIDRTSDPRVRGVGLGLRLPLVEGLLADPAALPALQWLEFHPENYRSRSGLYAFALARCREHWPLVTHGLTMSLGGFDPLCGLRELDVFLRATNASFHSEHLCFSSASGAMSHELLPLPSNDEHVCHVAARIAQVQDALSVPFAIENIVHYVKPPNSTMDEGDFVRAVCEEANCALLLDVNNVYVNAQNHGHDPFRILEKMPLERVIQIHVAGHVFEAEQGSNDLREPRRDGFLLDTHSEPVCPEVFALLEWVLARTGKVPILLERDSDIPPLATLYREVEALDVLWQKAPIKMSLDRGRSPESLDRGRSPESLDRGRSPESLDR